MREERRPATAVVMNMFYTGIGIARSLGARGIPVVGLTAQRGIYGNFTRYAQTMRCPDSRDKPEELLAFLLKFANKLQPKPVIFPTRDHDLVFLDRFRAQLEPCYLLAIPETTVLRRCLDKWETYLCAREAGIRAPRCWKIAGPEDLDGVLRELTFPCVLKPLAAYHWRKAGKWEAVGARKAFTVDSPEELREEYAALSRAEKQVLIQEWVPGGDEALLIQACYLDRGSRWVAGFNTQKLAQSPPAFGTGCIVQSVDRPELIEPTDRLLRAMRFTGIAEVEYKWSEATREFLLIEINPRPWDQHRLGPGCGVDLPYIAYCELAGLPLPAVRYQPCIQKWIAEDTFISTVIQMLWRRKRGIWALFGLARGKRVYAISSSRDPIPAIFYFGARFFPEMILKGLRACRSLLRRWFVRKRLTKAKTAYETRIDKANSPG